MSTGEIKLRPGVPRYTLNVTLTGVEYRIRLDWHERARGWYMSVARTSGEKLVDGLRVVSNWPLLRKVASRYRPPGMLVAAAEDYQAPQSHDFGTRVRLLYIEDEEAT